MVPISLLTAVAVMGKPPTGTFSATGGLWTVRGENVQTLGNVIVPEDVIKNYGVDILRLWFPAADFTSDVSSLQRYFKTALRDLP